MIRVAVAGACGKMGQSIIKSIAHDSSINLVSALERTGDSHVGNCIYSGFDSDLGIKITDDLSVLSTVDCLVDFTSPEASLHHLKICSQFGTRIVLGTTGFNQEGLEFIKMSSKDTAIVFSPNMSTGVNLTFKLIKTAAEVLDFSYDVEILEAHHKEKLDSPSGTALKMGEIIADCRSVKLSDVAVWSRHGNSCKRKSGEIGFSVIRGGDIPGEHSICFFGPGERIEIKHQGNNRSTYARGAIRAIHFLINKKTGLYDMQSVLEQSE